MTERQDRQPSRVRILCALLFAVLLCPACSSLEYDLSRIPIPVSAKPVTGQPNLVDPLVLQSKSILWVHGLFGQSNPDFAAEIAEAAKGYDRIADFRVEVSTGFHEWLVTHITASLIRMKTVRVTGHLVKDIP